MAKDPTDRIKPLYFNERTCQVLPMHNNMMQEQLDCLGEFASMKHLKFKKKKTSVMKFDPAKNHDFPPELFQPCFWA